MNENGSSLKFSNNYLKSDSGQIYKSFRSICPKLNDFFSEKH